MNMYENRTEMDEKLYITHKENESEDHIPAHLVERPLPNNPRIWTSEPTRIQLTIAF